MTDWKIVPASAHFARYAADWDRLNAFQYKSHPLFDSRFMAALLKHFAKGREQLCLHFTDNDLDGALIIRPRGLGRWQTFTPSQLPASPVLLRDATAIDALLRQLPGLAWQIDLLSLDPLYSPTQWGDLPIVITPHHKTITIEVRGDYKRYLHRRQKSLQQNLRRYQHRALDEFGSIKTQKTDTKSAIAEAIDRFSVLESAGWKGKAGTALEPNNPQSNFYRELLENFCATNQAEISELELDGRVVASRLTITNDNMVVFLKTAYDENLKRLAPGRLLLAEVIADYFSRKNGGAIEFYTNATVDQALWADTSRHTRHVSVVRNRMLLGAFTAIKLQIKHLSGPLYRGKESDHSALPDKTSKVFPSIDEFPDPVSNLYHRRHNHFELTPEWFSHLHSAVYQQSPDVKFLTTADSHDALAILPIRKYRRGLIRGFESLGNYYTSIFSPAVWAGGSPGEIKDLIEFATVTIGESHEARFSPMDPCTPEFHYLESGFISCGWIPFRFFCFGNWYLKSPGGWEEYLKTRSAKFRSNVSRAAKKFASANGRMELTVDINDAEKAIDAYVRVYNRSWKKPEPYPEFIPGLVKLLAKKGALRLGIAWVNNIPVAAQIWIVWRGRANIVKLAYDEDYASLSGGTALTAFLMQHVLDQDRVEEVDFLIGDDPYKKGWMSDRRERWGIVAYNPRTLIGVLLLWKEMLGRSAKRMLTVARAIALPRRGK